MCPRVEAIYSDEVYCELAVISMSARSSPEKGEKCLPGQESVDHLLVVEVTPKLFVGI
jgi:hypothetical protein